MQPRLLVHGDAAEYCGMSPPHFDAHIAPHVPALAFGRKQLWDRRALDAYIDRLSGFSQDPTCTVSAEEWLGRI